MFIFLQNTMKGKIQKMASDIATAVSMLKEEKIDEATVALESVATSIVEMDALATEQETTIAKSAEKIAKFASLNISEDDLPSLIGSLASIKDMLVANASAMAEQVEMMKSVSKTEDLTLIEKRLESIEKARDEKALKDEKREDMKKSAFAGLDLRPGV